MWFAWIKFYICGDPEASLLVVSTLRTSLNKSKYNKNKYDWLLQTNVGQNYNTVTVCKPAVFRAHSSVFRRGRKAYIRYLTLNQEDFFFYPKKLNKHNLILRENKEYKPVGQ